MYDTLVLIDGDQGHTLSNVEDALRQSFGGQEMPTVNIVGEVVRLSWPGFGLDVAINSNPSVLEESMEMANNFAPEPLRGRISKCSSRIEISGTDDPAMDYFNDFCFVLEAIEGMGQVYTFDPGTGEFTNV
jgi:hypothetical protein